MSMWTYVHGTIVVTPIGRTSHEKRFILETVLDHLPLVTGSERCMNVYVVERVGRSCTSSTDEFGNFTNQSKHLSNRNNNRCGGYEIQDEYIIVVDGAFRDRLFERTFAEFNKWINRLSKRVIVRNVLVELCGWDKKYVYNNEEPYYEMFDTPSWASDNGTERNWCEQFLADYDTILED